MKTEKGKLIQQRNEFLRRKKIPSVLFDEDTKHTITLHSPIEQHAAWLYQHIIRKDFVIHDILHACRVAFLAPIALNTLRICGHIMALAFPQNMMIPLQITGLCHDMAREGEGEDLWDQDSGQLLYYYLTGILAYDPDKAALFAEAIANKDWASGSPYYKLRITAGELVWEKDTSVTEKPVANIAIHEADCWDIARVHPFIATYSEIYKTYATENTLAFFILSRILLELKSVLERQGAPAAIAPLSKKRIILQTVISNYCLVYLKARKKINQSVKTLIFVIVIKGFPFCMRRGGYYQKKK